MAHLLPRIVLTAGLAAAVALGMTACGPAADVADPAAGATAQPADAHSASPSASPPQPSATQSTPASAAPAPAPAAPTGTMIPAPGAGAAPAVDGPLEAAPLPTESAELDEAIELETGVAVEIVAVEAIEVDAETPGEVSGPAVVVEVAARNDSAEPQPVDSAVVTLVAADGDLGVGTTAGSPSPLAGVIAPGESTSGRYVFMLDPAVGREVTVSVNYAAGEPVAVFTGTFS